MRPERNGRYLVLAERERFLARPRGVFIARAQVMSPEDIRRAITRISHEIVERNQGLDGVVLIGLQTGGVAIAERIAETLAEVEGADVPTGTIDVAYYRDDYGIRPVLPEASTEISVDLTDRRVVLVDDVLFTGRTVRAALNALGEFGRAQSIQLAVIVDRGHRELPIRPDFVGKNLPTRRDEQVNVSLDHGVVIGDVKGA